MFSILTSGASAGEFSSSESEESDESEDEEDSDDEEDDVSFDENEPNSFWHSFFLGDESKESSLSDCATEDLGDPFDDLRLFFELIPELFGFA